MEVVYTSSSAFYREADKLVLIIEQFYSTYEFPWLHAKLNRNDQVRVYLTY